jgi:hypothetical protein
MSLTKPELLDVTPEISGLDLEGLGGMKSNSNYEGSIMVDTQCRPLA